MESGSCTERVESEGRAAVQGGQPRVKQWPSEGLELRTFKWPGT